MAASIQTESPTQPLNSILSAAQTLPILDKLKLIRLLAEDIEKKGDIFPFETDKTYQFSTPYDTYEAAEILLEGLAAYNETQT